MSINIEALQRERGKKKLVRTFELLLYSSGDNNINGGIIYTWTLLGGEEEGNFLHSDPVKSMVKWKNLFRRSKT
jgi:hypothetical protein